MSIKARTEPSRHKRSFPSEGELSFEFHSKVEIARKACPREPLGRKSEYASYLGARQPYVVSEEGARIFAGGVPNRTPTPNTKPARPTKRFCDVSELVKDFDQKDCSILPSSIRCLNREINNAKMSSKGQYFFSQALKSLTAENNTYFSLADVERLDLEAGRLREEGYSSTKDEASRTIGLAKLAHSVLNDAQALEALRKSNASLLVKHNKFKALVLEIKELQEKIATYSPPDYIVALFELLQSSIYFTLVSITKDMLSKVSNVEKVEIDVSTCVKRGNASWKKFSELLGFTKLKTNFPQTWESIINPQAPEEGEEPCVPPVAFPTPSLARPSLISVTIFVKTVVEEILQKKRK